MPVCIRNTRNRFVAMNKGNTFHAEKQELRFSYFEPPINVKGKKPNESYTIQDAFDHLRSGDLKTITDKIRAATTKEAIAELKQQKFPFVTFSGIFETRCLNGLISRSQYFCVDLDHLGEKITGVKTAIRSECSPALMFLSPSGDGIKVILSVDTVGEHLEYFTAFQRFFKEQFNVEIDKACKDIPRACFLAHDPNVFMSDKPTLFEQSFLNKYGKKKEKQSYSDQDNNQQSPPKNKSYRSEDPMDVCIKMIQNAKDGHKHSVLLDAARLAGGAVAAGEIAMNDARAKLREAINNKPNVDDLNAAYKTIEDGLKDGVNDPLNLKQVSYVRVGPDYYKIIKVHDSHYGFSELKLKPWKKDEIRQDHGKDIFPKIRKFDEFTIVPDNINYHFRQRNCFNRYAEFRHKPVKGKWEWTKKFMEHIFGDQYDLGIRYMQVLYLRPDHLLPILCLVSRERETGKTTFLNWLNMIFGGNVANITPYELLSEYTESYADKNLILIEETSFEKKQTVEKIKALSTAKFITMNPKWVQKVNIPFFGKIVLTSNNEKGFIRIDQEEIRFFVRKVGKPEKHESEIERYLRDEIPAFLYYLTTLPPVNFSTDRTGFTPDELANESLLGLKDESHTGLYKMLKARIEEMFLNQLDDQKENEFYADAVSIKSEWFPYNNDITERYIHDTLQNEFFMKPADPPIHQKPFTIRSGKTARHYLFTRIMFVREPKNEDSMEKEIPF